MFFSARSTQCTDVGSDNLKLPKTFIPIIIHDTLQISHSLPLKLAERFGLCTFDGHFFRTVGMFSEALA